MKLLNLLLISSISFPAFADTVKCKITGATDPSVYSPFVGGKIFIDMLTANTRLVQGDQNLWPISVDKVSSFQVNRSACNFGWERILYSDGSLRAAIFKFNDCVLEDSYVRAEVAFDFKSNYGLYQEVRLMPVGESPYGFVEFKDCTITK